MHLLLKMRISECLPVEKLNIYGFVTHLSGLTLNKRLKDLYEKNHKLLYINTLKFGLLTFTIQW